MRLGGRVLESEAWRKGTGKCGLVEGHRKVRLGGRASESEAWGKGAGK